MQKHESVVRFFFLSFIPRAQFTTAQGTCNNPTGLQEMRTADQQTSNIIFCLKYTLCYETIVDSYA